MVAVFAYESKGRARCLLGVSLFLEAGEKVEGVERRRAGEVDGEEVGP
jgi:hypothetical protein